MLYIKPDYYDGFRCIADQCDDTCCAGWQIVVDPESLRRYRRERGPFRFRLRSGISWRKSVFHQDKEKRCAFLNDQNLCDMFTALGEESLCLTCRRYPRHIEEFEDVREMTLSVSCPEVARYLMKREDPVTFSCVETDEEESCPDFAQMDFDVLLYDILDEGRNTLLKILQERTRKIYENGNEKIQKVSIHDRCMRILHLASDMEEKMNEGEIFSCQDLFEKYESHRETFRKKGRKSPMNHAMKSMGCLFRLERLREDWNDLLTESASTLYLMEEQEYTALNQRFEKWQSDSQNNTSAASAMDLSILLEQLLVYFISTYFCGAVYDGHILAKAQASVFCVYMIYELWKARWIKNEYYLDREDLADIVYRFSRELEHSDQNLDRIEKIAAAALPV